MSGEVSGEEGGSWWTWCATLDMWEFAQDVEDVKLVSEDVRDQHDFMVDSPSCGYKGEVIDE